MNSNGHVLVSITGDPLSLAHIKLIEAAAALGEVVVAVISDVACQGNRQQPAQNIEQRKSMIKGLRAVDEVVTQHSWSYAEVIRQVKPRFFVHSDNWEFSHGQKIKLETSAALNEVDGELREIPFASGTPWKSSNEPDQSFPEARRRAISNLLSFDRTLAFIEAHSPLSALIVEKFKRVHGLNNDLAIPGYDGLWSSSLTDSTVRGVPDTEKLDFSQRMANVQEMFHSTTLPLIYDADTGGQTEHLIQNIRQMESLGVSACIIEDKTGLKRNSLFGNEVAQTQDSMGSFSRKIEECAASRSNQDFLIIARIESLILDKGLDDAHARSEAYLASGASAIMIHSRKKEEDEIAQFAAKFKRDYPSTPLVLVPTSYNHVPFQQLEDLGADIVIFANHLLRASHHGMLKTAESILKFGRTKEADHDITSVAETLSIIPGTRN